MKKKIFIIDGNSLLFRAYYATAYGDSSSIMRNKEGTPTNAIFAFANMICKILSSFKGGESIFVAFDADGKTFRKEEYSEYKANRKPCPPELIEQFPISRNLMKALGIVCYERTGIEADDIAGTVAKMASAKDYDVIVYTSDKDYLQLIDKNTKISLLKTGLSNMNVVDEEEMMAQFGLKPMQIIDYKGLRGDSSDNLPGIPGIGDKTAVKLIQEYGSFEAIVEAAASMKSKVGESIREYVEQGRACYRLATIKTDVELPFTLEDLEYRGYDFQEIAAFATKYELKQFLSRLPSFLKKGSKETISVKPVKVERLPKLEGKTIGLALDIDYQSYHSAELVGLAIADDKGVYYLSGADMQNDAYLRETLESEDIKKTVYDGKACIYALNRLGIFLKGVSDDILLASYLLDSSSASTPEIVYSSFGADISSEAKEELSLFSSEDIERTGKMAYFALALRDKYLSSLKECEALPLYLDIEMPLMKVLASTELEGFPIHKEVLLEYGKVFEKKKETIQEEIFSLAGHRFNPNSPTQTAQVLFEELHLGGGKGNSTSVEVLKKMEHEHPIVSKILEYRKYAKLIGTYIEGLIPHINEDSRIRSYFNQAQTSTGRLSSSSPNLQNISTRDEESKQIRKAFYYDDPDMYLLSIDYGQIELRILAALSGCKDYIDVFNTERDVHLETAKKIFGVEEPTHLQRRRAKSVNFAIIYGTTVFGLADQIEGSYEEAAAIIENFYKAYPEVKEFLQKIIKEATTQGYVKTMFGRRRYLRDVNDPIYAKREAARRAALNAPVQGSAADLIKIAMIKVDKFLREGGYKTKMVLQIHDELIFAVPKHELELMKEKITDIMVNAVSLPVRLTADPGAGKTWYDAKD